MLITFQLQVIEICEMSPRSKKIEISDSGEDMYIL